MQDLAPVGLSRDGVLILVNASGEEFSVPVDARLRAALRGDDLRLGQLEMKMESALRPRDIQARIRAGETPEEVAAAAQTTVESIMAFATPVLAERAYVAQNAMSSSVRRRSAAASTAAGNLLDCATLYFGDRKLHDEDVRWDAWRRPDGLWTLVAEYSLKGTPRRAEFSHDLRGRFVVAENDAARHLTGELREPDAPPVPRGRRLSAVRPQDELPLGDDAIELVREREPDAFPDDAPNDAPGDAPDDTPLANDPEVGRDARGDLAAAPDQDVIPDPVIALPRPTETADWLRADPSAAAEEPDRAADETTDDLTADHADADWLTDDRAAPETSTAAADAESGPPETDEVSQSSGDDTPPRRKKGRSSVPSWEDIMFGGGPPE